MDNEFPSGTVLHSRYAILERLGKSRVGTIYLAEDQESSAKVILKVLSHRFIPGEKSLDFLAKLLLEREHFVQSGLVQILNSFRIPLDSDKETIAVVLEKLSGVSLSDLLRHRDAGVQTLRDVVDIVLQVVDAVEFLHTKGVDVVPLHPRRVFLEEGRVKLPSFGYFTSAEWIRDGSKWGCTTGVDYRYVAPEMLEEGSFLTGGQKADIYLLGLLTYELLVGAPPFEANRETLMQLQRTEPIPENLLPENLPLWFLELLRGMLAKKPADRPALSKIKESLELHRREQSDLLQQLVLPVEGSFVRVLFVGDNRLDQLSVARMAKSERLPFHYRIAQTIEKAEEILEHREVDVIVTDHLLPDGTSFDLLKSGGLVPVIVITGSDKVDLKEAVLKAGAFACVTKDLRQAHLKSLPDLLVRAHKKSL